MDEEKEFNKNFKILSRSFNLHSLLEEVLNGIVDCTKRLNLTVLVHS